MSRFKGDALVLIATEGKRNPFGAWVNTYVYEGVASAVQAFVTSQPLGTEVTTEQFGAVVQARVTYAPDTFTDKWEVDRENLEKDIMYSQLAQTLSDKAKDGITAFRQSADPKSFNFSTYADPAYPNDLATMQKLAFEIRKGTESIPVSALILKRVRVMSVNLAPTLVLAEAVSFYSTAWMIQNQNIPRSLAATLPAPTAANTYQGAYAPPPNTKWGWLPRQQNRSYTGFGEMEEHSDWVFAPWSTYLYAFADA